MVRSIAPIDDPTWKVARVDLEDVVLAYMSESAPHWVLEGQR